MIDMGTIGTTILLAGAAAILFMTPLGRPIRGVVEDAKIAVGIEHEKLGWMDDAPFTEADRLRVAEISGRGADDQVSVIKRMQASLKSSVARRDYELMRQDWRRARSAYPDVKEDDLGFSTWVQVDGSAKIPAEWGGPNSNSSQSLGEPNYLDGPDYRTFVKPQYTNRASATETKAFLAADKKRRNENYLTHLKKRGYFTAWSSSDGASGSVNCYPDPLPSDTEPSDLSIGGQCVIVLNGATKYTFPFVASDWIDPPWDDADLVKMADAKGAKGEAYKPAPRKPWVVTDGSLARGQTCAAGRLCQSMWNADKDDYDNTDIGPDTPESWVLGSWGLHYLPSADNGERRSVVGKPWYLVASYYGFGAQASGGWTETDAKAAMQGLQTSTSYPMAGQDFEQMNRGNLKKARATQVPPGAGVAILADRALPTQPIVATEATSQCFQGMDLMPGQSCSFGIR